MRKRGLLSVCALLLAALALVAAGCGGDDDDEEAGGATTAEAAEQGGGAGGNVKALPSSSCQKLEYKGQGEPDVLIASDLPM